MRRAIVMLLAAAFALPALAEGNVAARYRNTEFPLTLLNPTDATDFRFRKIQDQVRITAIHCIVDPDDSDGTESAVINILECDATGDNCVSMDGTITCDNNGATDSGTIDNDVVEAGNYLKLDTGTITTPDTLRELIITIFGIE